MKNIRLTFYDVSLLVKRYKFLNILENKSDKRPIIIIKP